MPAYTVQMVRGLKGAPLSILVALALGGGARTAEWLERHTGYTDKPIKQALKLLNELGYIARSSGGWLPADGAMQLPLTAIDGGRNNSGHVVGVVVSNTDPPLDTVEQQHQQTRNNSDPGAARARAVLSALGMWPLVQTACLAVLPASWAGLQDVLGWAAYCADPEQGIANPPAVIAHHLRGGQQPPAPYRPPLLCYVCHRIDGACTCQDRSVERLHLPPSWDQRARQAPAAWGRDEELNNRWACAACSADPCQCQEVQ